MLSSAARSVRAAAPVANRAAAGLSAGRRFRSDATFAPRTEAMLPSDTYKDQVVLVTGGGTGLGKAMATRFSSLGASVVISSRKQEVISATAKEIEAISGRPVLAVPCDVASVEGVQSMLDSVEAELGLPNVIVNNAAGNFIAPSERLSANAFSRIVSIVLNGTANVTLEAARRLNAAERSAVFLAITTTYASTGSGYVLPSACAKSGVEALIKSLAAEWGPKYGHRFLGIAPGPIETEGAFSRLDPTGQFKKMMIQRSPSQRLGVPDELANLATFLCSPYASWMSGEIVNFDGGETVALGGEFNALQQVSNKEWDMLEEIIRKGNKKGGK